LTDIICEMGSTRDPNSIERREKRKSHGHSSLTDLNRAHRKRKRRTSSSSSSTSSSSSDSSPDRKRRKKRHSSSSRSTSAGSHKVSFQCLKNVVNMHESIYDFSSIFGFARERKKTVKRSGIKQSTRKRKRRKKLRKRLKKL